LPKYHKATGLSKNAKAVQGLSSIMNNLPSINLNVSGISELKTGDALKLQPKAER
jgi:hypothetical protein